MNSQKYIIDRLDLYHKICHSDQKDAFLDDICSITPHSDLRTNKRAKQHLTKNYKELCFELKASELDVLIGGSTALVSVYKKANFKPHDIDLYVKNINKDKVMIIENIIRKLYPNNNILVIRNVITITWIVHDNYVFISQFQLNILNLTSWAEFFITCHSNLLCLGFDVQEDKFVFLKDRWLNSLTTNVHIFCNILNCDSSVSLSKAVMKYNMRGFNCQSLLICDYIDAINHDDFYGNHHHANVSETLLSHLTDKYSKMKNIFYSTSAMDSFIDKKVPNITDMWKLKSDPQFEKFIRKPSDIRLKEGVECSIETEKHNILVKNIMCSHTVSLRAFLTSYNIHRLKACPICRSEFIPELYSLDVNKLNSETLKE
jgi:hypothetical protein